MLTIRFGDSVGALTPPTAPATPEGAAPAIVPVTPVAPTPVAPTPVTPPATKPLATGSAGSAARVPAPPTGTQLAPAAAAGE